MDQTATLRQAVAVKAPGRIVRVVAVTSGKGGVGKTNVTANLAVALAHLGRRVMVLDADLGLGNLDVLLGLTPSFSLADVLSGQRRLREVLVPGPGGITVLPAGSGFQNLTALSDHQIRELQSEMDELQEQTDILLIDTGAGIGRNVTSFATMAQDIIVVAAPEPTSLTDAYALMKVLSTQYGERRFRLLVSMTRTPTDGQDVYRKLSLVAERFLHISINFLGSIPFDPRLTEAVCQQRPLVELYPQSKAAQAFLGLAHDLAEWPLPESPKGGLQFFWQSLLRKDQPL
ncbi:MAG: MinD/ParA family protein [Nitrospirota bacterium]